MTDCCPHSLMSPRASRPDLGTTGPSILARKCAQKFWLSGIVRDKFTWPKIIILRLNSSPTGFILSTARSFLRSPIVSIGMIYLFNRRFMSPGVNCWSLFLLFNGRIDDSSVSNGHFSFEDYKTFFVFHLRLRNCIRFNTAVNHIFSNFISIIFHAMCFDCSRKQGENFVRAFLS